MTAETISDGTHRTAEIRRQTRETTIELALDVDAPVAADISTGIGFLDHMLDSLARHSRFDLTIKATGDLHIDAHHTPKISPSSSGRRSTRRSATSVACAASPTPPARSTRRWCRWPST